MFATFSCRSFVTIGEGTPDRENDVSQFIKRGQQFFRKFYTAAIVVEFLLIAKFSLRYILLKIELAFG